MAPPWRDSNRRRASYPAAPVSADAHHLTPHVRGPPALPRQRSILPTKAFPEVHPERKFAGEGDRGRNGEESYLA